MDNIDLQIWYALASEWLLEYVLVWANLLQAAAIIVTFLIVWLVAPVCRRWHAGWMASRGLPLAPGTLCNTINDLIFPALWLLMLWMGVSTADYLGGDRQILRIISSLLGAWIIIRFTSTLVHDLFLAKVIAVSAWTLAALNILNLLTPTMAILDGISFSVGKLHLSVLLLLKGIIFLVLFMWSAILFSKFIESRLQKSPSLTPSARVLTAKFLRISLITAAFLLALSSVGIDLTLFAVFGGALGVGLGFGLQKVVSNFISGIILLLDKSIKPGDVISIGDTYGWVNSLNARYVSLDTRNGIEHLIPNEELIINRVENWSYSHSRIRLQVPVGIHYKSDVRKAMEICREAAASNERILADPEPVCQLSGFGDSSVDLVIRMWIDDPQNGRTNVISDILLTVWDKFHEHGIEIPYPQRDLYLKTPVTIKPVDN
jgi:small-conductance mechanosensitive channel